MKLFDCARVGFIFVYFKQNGKFLQKVSSNSFLFHTQQTSDLKHTGVNAVLQLLASTRQDGYIVTSKNNFTITNQT